VRLCFDLDFGLAVVVGVVDSAGRTSAGSAFFGAATAGVLLSSAAGAGGAAAEDGGGCCRALTFCAGAAFVAPSTGSVSPPELTQAFQPPSRARALNPLSRSVCAARALVCSSGQEQ
jgi:hypothetical protein